MLKLIFGTLTIALLATGCGSGSWSGTIGGRGAATTGGDDQQVGNSTVARPAPRPTAAQARTGPARVDPRAAAPARKPEAPLYREFTLPVGTTLPLELGIPNRF